MKLHTSLLLGLIISALAGLGAARQAPCQSSWVPTFGKPSGSNLSIATLAVHDEGNGSSLYAGGFFSLVSGVQANHIARWDGSSWAALGSGMANSGTNPTWVSALASFDDGSGSGPALFAGGVFSTAGGVAANSIAKWDGTAWSPLGNGVVQSPYGVVSGLAVFDDGSGPALYVAGDFSMAGLTPANNIARWDGSSWSTLGSGLDSDAYAMTVFDDGTGEALYVSGRFKTAGGVPANSVAKWDGSQWSALGAGITYPAGNSTWVFDLAEFDDGTGPALFAGGLFTHAGGQPANRIAKWDGTAWSTLGTGVDDQVDTLTVFDDGSGPALYVGGDFVKAGGVTVNRIARWNGTSWTALGGGIPGAGFPSVNALTAFDDGQGGGSMLIAAGGFSAAGGAEVKNIARWNGTKWLPVGPMSNALDHSVHASRVFDDGHGPALFVGGRFTSAGGEPPGHVAKWNGTQWSAVGAGLSDSVHSFGVFDDGSGPALYAGGVFGGALRRWNGSQWSLVGGGLRGVGFFSYVGVFAMEVFDDGTGGGPALFVGGLFDSPTSGNNNLARWNGSSLVSLPFFTGSQFDTVHALKVFDDGSGSALFVGRNAFINGNPDLVKWDGSSASFTPVEGFAVYALQVFDDGNGPALYAGGSFTSVDGVQASNIAKWDGSSWTEVGGGVNGNVNALTVFDDGTGQGPALFASGLFTTAGGVAAQRIAKWDGTSWSGLGIHGSAMTPGQQVVGGGVALFTGTALAVFDDGLGSGPALFAGGDFTTSAAGDAYLAKWGCATKPPFPTFCTAKTQLVCGPADISATGSPSATAASGFTIKAQPVRGCRAGLLLYSNQPPVTAAPFGGPGDGVLCLVGSGLKRAGPIMTGSSPQFCEATFAIDMNRFRANNWAAGGCNPPPGQTNPAGFLGDMGTTVNAQMWGRDSIATGQVLSDGISWVIGP